MRFREGDRVQITGRNWPESRNDSRVLIGGKATVVKHETFDEFQDDLVCLALDDDVTWGAREIFLRPEYLERISS